MPLPVPDLNPANLGEPGKAGGKVRPSSKYVSVGSVQIDLDTRDRLSDKSPRMFQMPAFG